MKNSRWQYWRVYSVAIVLALTASTSGPGPALADPNHEADTANWIALRSAASTDFSHSLELQRAAPSPQSVLQFHRNWHCANRTTPARIGGNRFFGFHKQFLLGYDRYLTSVGEPHIQTWVAAPGALILRPTVAAPTTHRARRVRRCRVRSNFLLPAARWTVLPV